MAIKQKIFLIALCWMPLCAFMQNGYGFEITKNPVECAKGAAVLTISGTEANDTISILWSNGEQNVNQLTNLDEGDYSVSISINPAADTIQVDTTLRFKIEKELCKVSVSNHFTPNGDDYNDVLQITYVNNHPNFEFEVYNKWGQRVHSQKSTYIPWDGKWAGTNVPDGTYYYVFFYDTANKKNLVKGSITILR